MNREQQELKTRARCVSASTLEEELDEVLDDLRLAELCSDLLETRMTELGDAAAALLSLIASDRTSHGVGIAIQDSVTEGRKLSTVGK